MALSTSQDLAQSPLASRCGLCGDPLSGAGLLCALCRSKPTTSSAVKRAVRPATLSSRPIRKVEMASLGLFVVAAGLFATTLQQPKAAVPQAPVVVRPIDVSALLPSAAEQRRAEAPLATPAPFKPVVLAVAVSPVAPLKPGAFRRVDPGDRRFKGLGLPLDSLDGLPNSADLYPGAPRAYRNGWHEGLDFYPEGRWNAAIHWGSPVMAVADAVVDSQTTFDFQEMTPSAHQGYLASAHRMGYTPMDVLLRLRGRSVWLDHGNGLKTVYAHLSSIDGRLRPGMHVHKGQLLGYVGNTGTTAGVNHTQQDFHLHFEMWLDGQIAGWHWSKGDFARVWPLEEDEPRNAALPLQLSGR
jgi:murein DD-endopeptidase MepM/ murein hydrolase activator NlpD